MKGARQSRFAKRPLDAYDTIDLAAVPPLLPYLPAAAHFCEPCAGKGDLVRQLVAAGFVCDDAADIAPRAAGIRQCDGRAWRPLAAGQDLVITNPPFEWPLVRDLLNAWALHVPITWVLLPVLFAHRKQAGRLIQRCHKIVTIGSLRWEAGTEHKSVDVYAWFQFARTPAPGGGPILHGRSWGAAAQADLLQGVCGLDGRGDRI